MKLYKFSHFINYSGDEEQTFQVEPNRTAVDRATTGAPRANGALPDDSGNHRQCRWSGETGRRDRRTFDPRDASSGQSNDGKLGQQSRKNPRRTIKAEGALGWRT